MIDVYARLSATTAHSDMKTSAEQLMKLRGTFTSTIADANKLANMQTHVNSLIELSEQQPDNNVKHLVRELTRRVKHFESVIITGSFPIVLQWRGDNIAAERLARKVDEMLDTVTDEEYKKKLTLTVDTFFEATRAHTDQMVEKYAPDMRPLYALISSYILMRFAVSFVSNFLHPTFTTIANTVIFFFFFIAALYFFNQAHQQRKAARPNRAIKVE